METTIQQIIRLSGPMPKPEAFERYLRTLSVAQLQERASALLQDQTRTLRSQRQWQGRNRRTLEGLCPA